jgi:hypothetical protein
LNNSTNINGLEALIESRLRHRVRYAQRDEFDRVHRELILRQSLLFNPMYQALFADELRPRQVALFLSEYYHGSIAGFLREVMPLALNAYQEPLWGAYIRQIRLEESKPRNHAILFEEFMASVGVVVDPPRAPALEFIAASKRGYTLNLPHSCGYALAVEVEADYQIAVVAAFARRHFGAGAVAGNTWFDTHLDVTGEEEHARQTVVLSEVAVKDAADFQEFVLGFEHACRDTERFMLSLHGLMRAQEVDDA